MQDFGNVYLVRIYNFFILYPLDENMKGNEFITKNNFSHLENVTGASDLLPDSILQLSENLLSLSLHPNGQFHGWKLVRDKKAFCSSCNAPTLFSKFSIHRAWHSKHSAYHGPKSGFLFWYLTNPHLEVMPYLPPGNVLGSSLQMLVEPLETAISTQ